MSQSEDFSALKKDYINVGDLVLCIDTNWKKNNIRDQVLMFPQLMEVYEVCFTDERCIRLYEIINPNALCPTTGKNLGEPMFYKFHFIKISPNEIDKSEVIERVLQE